MSKLYKLIFCPICEHQNIVFLYNTNDRHYGHFDDNYDVYRCKKCDVHFINPLIDSEKLHLLYPSEDYYAYSTFSLSKSKIQLILRAIKFLFIGSFHIKLKTNKSYKILDIGCGSGEFLYKCKCEGLDVYGIEVNNNAANRGNKLGLNIINTTLDRASFSDSFFNIVRSNHSFEHILNPVETIKEISRITMKGGHFLLGVPNTRSLPYFLFRKYWFYTGVPFHPFNYNLKPLRFLLENNNFKIVKIKYVGNFLGLAGSLQIYVNRKSRRTSSQGIFNNLFVSVIFHQFARLLNLIHLGDCIEILAEKQ